MLEFHPFANAFPLIKGARLDELAASIGVKGVRRKIALFEDKILDGRNRYRAAIVAGLIDPDKSYVPETEEFRRFFFLFSPEIHGDPLDYVEIENLNRRDMDPGQRAWAAAEMERFRHGGSRRGQNQDAHGHLDRETLAERHHTSVRSIARAAKVRDEGVEPLKEAVRDGDIAPRAAEQIAALPQARQLSILDQLRDESGKIKPEVKKALAPVIKEIRAEKLAEKRERRDNREIIGAAKTLALPGQLCGIGLEDFEWDDEVYSRETGMDRHAANHYPTADTAHTPEEIVARCAERFKALAPDCILFKWTTRQHAYIAMKVMDLQGFTYKTQLGWAKKRNGNARGKGKWFSDEHEILLVGTRGTVVPPATAHYRSWFDDPVGEHSAKPDHVYDIIEYHWPNTPKIEFNARQRRPGWYAWGFDAPTDAETLSACAHDPAVDETAGQDGSSSGSDAHPADNLPPVEPPAVEVGCGQAGETNSDAAADTAVTAADPVLTDSPVSAAVGLPANPNPAARDGDQCEPNSASGRPRALDVGTPGQGWIADDDAEWQALSEVRAGIEIDGELCRHLIGEGLAFHRDDRLSLTDMGKARLQELIAARVANGTRPPKQSETDPLDIPAFLRRPRGGSLPEQGAA